MSTEPFDVWADCARAGLIDTPEACAFARRGDRPSDVAGTPAELRARAMRLLTRLAEETGEPVETYRDVDDEDLGRYCAELERRIAEAR